MMLVGGVGYLGEKVYGLRSAEANQRVRDGGEEGQLWTRQALQSTTEAAGLFAQAMAIFLELLSPPFLQLAPPATETVGVCLYKGLGTEEQRDFPS
jgi:hypothetical protein